MKRGLKRREREDQGLVDHESVSRIVVLGRVVVETVVVLSWKVVWVVLDDIASRVSIVSASISSSSSRVAHRKQKRFVGGCGRVRRWLKVIDGLDEVDLN